MANHAFCLALLVATAIAVPAQEFRTASIPMIEISGPNTDLFQAQARELTLRARSMVEPILPYSFALTNHSSKTISYFVVRYDHLGPNKDVVRTVVRTSGANFAPGATTLAFPISGLAHSVEAGINFTSILSSEARLLPLFRATPVVKATIDAVVFQDLEFVGADTTETYAYLNGLAGEVQAFLAELETLAQYSPERLAERLDTVRTKDSPFLPLSETGGKTTGAANEAATSAALVKANAYTEKMLISSALSRALKSTGIQDARNAIKRLQTDLRYASVWRNQ